MGWKKNKIDKKVFKNKHICNLLKYKYFLFKKVKI